jgi:hypothetical protein
MQGNVGSSLGGSSLLLHSTQSAFDLRVESEVISLLRTIHQNTIDPDLKNHLRDLIFAFRQDQNSENLKKVAEAFLPLGITIVMESESVIPKEVIADTPLRQNTASLGILRPKPRFASPSAVIPNVDAVKTEVVPLQDLSNNNVMPKEDAVEQVSATPIVPTVINHAERIKEIKQIINEKVGNPVNLMTKHKEIGQEYMSALLDAMKKSNGGQEQAVISAMNRLEKAFKTVTDALNGLPPISNKVQQEEIKVIQTPQEPIAKEVVINSEQTSAGVQSEVPHEVVKEPEVAIKIPVTSSVTSRPVVEEKELHTAKSGFVARNPFADAELETEKVVEQQSEPSIPSVSRENQQTQDVPHDTKPVEVPKQPESEIHSMAKEKQLQDLLRDTRQKESVAYKKEEEKKIAAMDPLYTPAITSGLDQLLSEWGLFKNSGIFGTGPSGKDHALYQKLAPLTMATVIAGRFDGATPHIKQSITDYMNGWRYEEGIVHELGENFEHYLRRVIKHILEKKK